MKALIFWVYLFVSPVSVLNSEKKNFEINSKVHVSAERKIAPGTYTDFSNDIDFVLTLFDNIQRWFIWWSSLVLW